MRNLSGHLAVHVIVDEGKASKVVNHLRDLDLVDGGTIVNAIGTAKSSILHFLELHHQRKEFLIMAVEKEKEKRIMDEIEEELSLDKKNTGIAFSVDIFKTSWKATDKEDGMTGVGSGYEAVFVIVENGKAEEVIDISQEAGAKGATIIHARGSGVSVQGQVFGMVIEPEKNIVLMLIKSEDVDVVIESISREIDIEKPGNGIIFAMDVNRTVGILE